MLRVPGDLVSPTLCDPEQVTHKPLFGLELLFNHPYKYLHLCYLCIFLLILPAPTKIIISLKRYTRTYILIESVNAFSKAGVKSV